jgi:hypothetical protein
MILDGMEADLGEKIGGWQLGEERRREASGFGEKLQKYERERRRRGGQMQTAFSEAGLR